MAKLHKIEMYIVDIDEHYGTLANIIEHINERLELVELCPFKEQTVDFDWHDEHELNMRGAKYKDYAKHFKK